MQLLLSFLLIAITKSTEVTQFGTWFRTKVDLPNHTKDTLIKITQTSSVKPLLLLVNLNSWPKYEFDYEKEFWKVSADFYDFDAWALGTVSSYVVVPAEKLKKNDHLYIGVYKRDSGGVSYEITVENLNYDNDEFDDYDYYEDKVYFLEFQETNYFSLLPYTWEFYEFEIKDSYLDLECKQKYGNPYMFIGSDLEYPSMFNYEEAFWFKEKTIHHTLEDAEEDKYLLSVFCFGQVSCHFSCELSKEIDYESKGFWILILVFVGISMVCVVFPIVLRKMISRRSPEVMSQSSDAMSPNDISELIPERVYHHDKSKEVCAICLDNFEEGVFVRELRCNHLFHKCCFDCWAIRHPICPLCKVDITQLRSTHQENNIAPPTQVSAEMQQNYLIQDIN